MNLKLLFLIATVLLLLGSVIYVGFQVPTVEALVPSIVSVSSHDVESITWLDVLVTHQPPPTIDAPHFVSVVQLEINGSTVDLTQGPQSAETFTVQYSLGPNTNSYSVRARALCNLHGYSSWYSAPTPTPTPTATPTPTPTSTPTPSIEPTPTPTSSPSPSPSASLTPSPEPTTTPSGNLPPEALYAAVAIGIAGIAVITYVVLKREKK